MYKEIEVNRDLYHLLFVLLDLDNYKFDQEVISLLNQLYSLVNKKLFFNFDFDDCNIMEEKLILRFFSKN